MYNAYNRDQNEIIANNSPSVCWCLDTRRYKKLERQNCTYQYRHWSTYWPMTFLCQYILVCTGTYWYVPISAVQPGYAALLLDSLQQFCPSYKAVLETSASNHTNASSSKFQSTLGLAPDYLFWCLISIHHASEFLNRC